MTEDQTSHNGATVVSFYPSTPEHLADAVAEAGCTVGALNGNSRGLVVTGRVDATELSGMLSDHPGVEWVQLPSAGIEAFLPAVQSEAGARLTWTSAKGAYAQPVAEHAVGLSIALLRILHRRARTSSWSTVPEGKSLAGMEVLVVGAGGIGVEIIRLLNAFGANVTAVRKKPEAVPGAVRTVDTARLA